jgi:hypothetical protein
MHPLVCRPTHVRVAQQWYSVDRQSPVRLLWVFSHFVSCHRRGSVSISRCFSSSDLVAVVLTVVLTVLSIDNGLSQRCRHGPAIGPRPDRLVKTPPPQHRNEPEERFPSPPTKHAATHCLMTLRKGEGPHPRKAVKKGYGLTRGFKPPPHRQLSAPHTRSRT